MINQVEETLDFESFLLYLIQILINKSSAALNTPFKFNLNFQRVSTLLIATAISMIEVM